MFHDEWSPQPAFVLPCVYSWQLWHPRPDIHPIAETVSNRKPIAHGIKKLLNLQNRVNYNLNKYFCCVSDKTVVKVLCVLPTHFKSVIESSAFKSLNIYILFILFYAWFNLYSLRRQDTLQYKIVLCGPLWNFNS